MCPFSLRKSCCCCTIMSRSASPLTSAVHILLLCIMQHSYPYVWRDREGLSGTTTSYRSSSLWAWFKSLCLLYDTLVVVSHSFLWITAIASSFAASFSIDIFSGIPSICHRFATPVGAFRNGDISPRSRSFSAFDFTILKRFVSLRSVA